MIAIIKTLQVILALSVLILVHELGHFAFAKIFGIRVDKFFLFFDAGGKKIFSTKSAWFVKIFPKAAEWETEYGIGWLPLGGYCKIAGMVDESMDTEYLKNEPQEWEFRTKPAWQRLLVMAGGVLFNFIFAIVMYIALLAGWGESYIGNEGNCIYVNELAYDMGFRNGDQILMFDDYVPENFGMLQADLVRQSTEKVTVLRDGDTATFHVDQNLFGAVLNTPGMFDLAVPFKIREIAPGSPNADMDLKAGDQVISIDSTDVEFVQDAWTILEAHTGAKVPVSVLRGSDTLTMEMAVDTAGKLGVYLVQPEIMTKEYTAISAIPAGFRKTFSSIGDYLKDLKMVATPSTEAYKSVGSFISIGKIFPATWDWHSFWNITAFLLLTKCAIPYLNCPVQSRVASLLWMRIAL